MKAFLVALFFLITAPAPLFAATEVQTPAPATVQPPAPTEPPPFVPGPPTVPSTAPVAPGNRPSHDVDELLKSLLGVDDDDDGPDLKCTAKPCVFGYRFSDPVNERSVKKVVRFLGAAKSAGADVVMIEINTPGGSADEGHEMSRAIENAPFPVVCVVDGTAYSMGMYILQSCDARVMTKRSSLMIHQVSLMTGAGARLTQVSTENSASIIKVATRSYIEWVTHRMKNTNAEDTIKRIDNGHEWFLDWQDAIRYGAVDEVIVGPPEAYFAKLRKTGKP